MFLSRFGAAVDAAAAAAVNFVCALAYAELLRRLAVNAPKCMLCCSPAGAVSDVAAGIVPAIISDNCVASIGCVGVTMKSGCGGGCGGC